jgi:hypothetical protein
VSGKKSCGSYALGSEDPRSQVELLQGDRLLTGFLLFAIGARRISLTIGYGCSREDENIRNIRKELKEA